MKSFEEKLARELKWLLVSFAIVSLSISSLFSVAAFCQWRVKVNELSIERMRTVEQIVEF